MASLSLLCPHGEEILSYFELSIVEVVFVFDVSEIILASVDKQHISY